MMPFSKSLLKAIALLTFTATLGAASPTPQPGDYQPGLVVREDGLASMPFPGAVTVLPNGVTMYGAPEELSPNPAQTVKRDLQKRDDGWCGDSTFINQSSPGSPLAADCAVIRDTAYNLRPTQYWKVGTCSYWSFCYFVIYSYGTCRFGASTPGGGSIMIAGVDIGDVVRDSIIKFQWFDKVGSKGDMDCEACCLNRHDLPSPLKWGVY
jgi:hypothetical protein